LTTLYIPDLRGTMYRRRLQLTSAVFILNETHTGYTFIFIPMP